jgi:hypothetical protein
LLNYSSCLSLVLLAVAAAAVDVATIDGCHQAEQLLIQNNFRLYWICRKKTWKVGQSFDKKKKRSGANVTKLFEAVIYERW